MGYPQICYFGIPITGIQPAAAALCWTGLEKIPHVQGQRNPSKTVGTGAAVRRFSSHSKGEGQRRSPSKMIGGVNSHLESNPIPARDIQRAQTNLVHTRTQEPHRD